MTEETIRAFVASLKREMRVGHVTALTEHHLRREISQIGWGGDDTLHAAKVDEEIRRLEGEVRVLRTLREAAFGVMATTAAAPPG